MRIPKPQTSDPLDNHTVRGGEKNGGEVDFSGQESYDDQANDTPASEAAEERDVARYMNYSTSHNPHNGSGGTRKVINPSDVHGSNMQRGNR